MGLRQSQFYCPRCGEARLFQREGTNHVLHLLLSVVTGGLWLVVWVVCGLSSKPWRCIACGTVPQDEGIEHVPARDRKRRRH